MTAAPRASPGPILVQRGPAMTEVMPEARGGRGGNPPGTGCGLARASAVAVARLRSFGPTPGGAAVLAGRRGYRCQTRRCLPSCRRWWEGIGPRPRTRRWSSPATRMRPRVRWSQGCSRRPSARVPGRIDTAHGTGLLPCCRWCSTRRVHQRSTRAWMENDRRPCSRRAVRWMRLGTS